MLLQLLSTVLAAGIALAPFPPSAAAVDDLPTDHVLAWEALSAAFDAAGLPVELSVQAAWVARCESSWRPAARNGVMLGLFQIHGAIDGWAGWFAYAGEDEDQWSDPVVNTRVAWAVIQYSRARGQADWSQWDLVCQPPVAA